MRLVADISAFQTHNWDWSARQAYDLDSFAGAVDAAWVRWTDWYGYVRWGADPDYELCINTLRDLHKLVGGYLFCRPEMSDPTTQIRAWRDATPPTTWAPMLDLETNGGLSPVALSQWVDAALAEMADRFQRIPWLYTQASKVAEWGLIKPVAPHLLIVAGEYWYGTKFSWADRASWEQTAMSVPPTLPDGWSHWDGWQFTSRAEVPGMGGLIDCSLVTENAFAQSGGGVEGGFNDMERDLLRSLGAPL